MMRRLVDINPDLPVHLLDSQLVLLIFDLIMRIVGVARKPWAS